jgi:hypothetical protein
MQPQHVMFVDQSCRGVLAGSPRCGVFAGSPLCGGLPSWHILFMQSSTKGSHSCQTAQLPDKYTSHNDPQHLHRSMHQAKHCRCGCTVSAGHSHITGVVDVTCTPNQLHTRYQAHYRPLHKPLPMY